MEPLSWEFLKSMVNIEDDLINGDTNSYAKLRLFGRDRKDVRVILYRDNHAWCPYCQKIWLWLELKEIPYEVRKVTMRCYGNKESWYLKKVSTGMLPAIELDTQLITESDEIIFALEKCFGPLGTKMSNSYALRIRNLERKLFRAWCLWLCRPNKSQEQDNNAKIYFKQIAQEVESAILSKKNLFFDPTYNKSNILIPGTLDVIFIPYLERMNASIAYYKGVLIREEHPIIDKWFSSLEKLKVYRGTQGDFHTHVHDLPPQMGGCWFSDNSKQEQIMEAIDSGEGLGEAETSFSIPNNSDGIKPEHLALERVIKHKNQIKALNPFGAELFDQPLRAALSNMMLSKTYLPLKGSSSGLRYLRDRISVPRDMPLLSARKFRQALERTAKLDGPEQGPPISTINRFDQNPESFISTKI